MTGDRISPIFLGKTLMPDVVEGFGITQNKLGAVRAVGFDLDGTLFDHRGSATDGVRVFLQNLGADPSVRALDLWFAAEDAEFEHWRAGRISFQEQRRRRLRSVLTALNVEFDDEPTALDLLFEQYLREYRQAWRPFPDAIDVLLSLRARGLRLGLLTNGNEEQQLTKLEVIGLTEHFDVVCISEAIGVQKPDVGAFYSLARLLDVEPRQCLFIGDNPEHDIDGATETGMRAALIERYRVGAGGLSAVIERALASAGDAR